MILGKGQRDVFKIQDTKMQTKNVNIYKMYFINL